MKYTGERFIPGVTIDARMAQEHISRYVFAMHPYCTHRKVLDLAAGAGYGTQIISWAAEHAIGADRDAETIGYANRYFHGPRTTFTICDAQNIVSMFGREKFDVVVSFETIEHLSDPVAFANKVSQVLVPGGLFIVSAPENSGSVWHVRDYNKQDLETTLIEAYPWQSMRYFVQNFGTEYLIEENGEANSAHPTHIFVCEKGQEDVVYSTSFAAAVVA